MTERPDTYATVTAGAIRVTLIDLQARPYDEIIAAARTCYSSKGPLTPAGVGVWPAEKSEPLLRSIYEAGHHTTLQHSHATFIIEGVTRQTIWSFLHSHPFYNSEQVSQRYVAVAPEAVTIPAGLNDAQRKLFADAIEKQMTAYHELCAALTPDVEKQYLALFPSRAGKAQTQTAVTRRAQEIARYVLPLATQASLHHTISLVTLLRYHRVMRQYDIAAEQAALVDAMTQLVLQAEPRLDTILQEPLAENDFPEFDFFAARGGLVDTARAQRFIAEFDASLEGKTSRLISAGPCNETLLADAVREVLAMPRTALTDDDAIDMALDPNRNAILAQSLALGTLHKLTRAICHPRYTFRKKLSHCADSQDQRHRMTPASRPVLMAHYTGKPDVITPSLIAMCDKAKEIFDRANDQCWETANALLADGAAPDNVLTLLPNALAVRFTQSADLLNLRHKMAMRLCFNAQEEINLASAEEAAQIADAEPRIGRYLSPPCVTRKRGGVVPPCPEGARYCGRRPWLD